MEFEIGDYVQIKGEGERLFPVSGVIHDSERLFVEGCIGEVEVKFSDVIEQWRKVSKSTKLDSALAAPEPDAMEMVDKVRATYDYAGYALSRSEAAALIESHSKRVPRAMLREIYVEGGEDMLSVMTDETIDRLTAKFGYRAE